MKYVKHWMFNIQKLDFPPFLHILLHMIDFMSHWLILCMINFLYKLKYRMRQFRV